VLFLRTTALALLLCSGCAPLTQVLPLGDADERMARSVTIVRDEWGVPTIYGPTDAAVAFGVAWVQAEDNYWQLEEDVIHALGRASHYYGDEYLAADLVKAAFEVERLSREEYEREPPERRALWDAYAAGLNYYLRMTPNARPRVIPLFEPWMPFALLRTVDAETVIDGVSLGDIVTVVEEVRGDGVHLLDVQPAPSAGVSGAGARSAAARGSLAWAVSGEDGQPRLLQALHAPFFGAGQPYELHVHSDDGWHVRGVTVPGVPIPMSGHNEHLAWALTETGVDHADVYEVAFEHPSDPAAYRHGDEWRRIETWDDTIRVNGPTGVEARVFRFRRTHHGPIISGGHGVALAVRVARMEAGGALQQWYAMGRATDLDGFRQALDQRALAGWNTMYADNSGNAYLLHGNAVPRRDASFDWSQPVPGNSPATDWQGWHELNDLPQLLNPASGWLQDTGGSPFLATADAWNLDAADFPAYMATEPDDARTRSVRRLLDAGTSWSGEALEAAVFDTYVADAEDAFRDLVREWEEVGGTHPERAMRVDQALDAMRGWDLRADTGSHAMTLFVMWQQRLRSGAFDGTQGSFRALEDVVATLRQEWDTVLVPWGHVNRLQRRHTSGRDAFDDTEPSLPVAGAPAWTGSIFAVQGPPGLDVRRYGVRGNAWVSVTELGPQVRSRAVTPFGQSADPASPHWFDQAPLYVSGRLRPAWFGRDEVDAGARRRYRPGEIAVQ
jgi:acyl-homoserine-lactone acylase